MNEKRETKRMKEDSKVFGLEDQLKLSAIENTVREGWGVIYNPCNYNEKLRPLIGEYTQRRPGIWGSESSGWMYGFESQKRYKERV